VEDLRALNNTPSMSLWSTNAYLMPAGYSPRLIRINSGDIADLYTGAQRAINRG